jgi:chromatin modification-related protein VID21
MDVDGASGEQGEKENAYSDQESGDEDDDGEVEQRDIVDPLETRNALEEALERSGSRSGSGSGESGESSQRPSMGPEGSVKPKLEDVEDSSALKNESGGGAGDAMEVDGEGELEQDAEGGTTKTEVVDLVALKLNSNDPVLGSLEGSELPIDNHPVPGSSKHVSKSNLYAPLREKLAYSDVKKLFVDNDDLDLVKALSDLTTEDSKPHSPSLGPTHNASDLSDLFPDLQLLGIPDLAPFGSESKKSDKKSEREDNRRVDDSGYTKMAPMGKFMFCKPTLLGPLQPAKRWRKGRWFPPEEPAVTEAEASSSKISEEHLSGELGLLLRRASNE